MPIHDYQCSRCAHRFEQLVRRNEVPDCPVCGAGKPQRLFSGTAAVSTGKTRARALAGARSRASSEKREKDHAHSVYLANHIKDHS